MLRTKKTWEFVALAVRLVLWTVFITLPFGLSTSAGLYLAANWFGSNYIFLNFAVSHSHLDVVPKDDLSVI